MHRLSQRLGLVLIGLAALWSPRPLAAVNTSVGFSSVPETSRIFFAPGGSFRVGDEEPASFNEFQLDSSNGVGDAVGTTGDLDGTFQVGEITAGEAAGTEIQFALVSGEGSLAIRDAAGAVLRGRVEWRSIVTVANSLTLNTFAEANVSELSYDGDSQDFQAIAAASEVTLELATNGGPDGPMLRELVARGGEIGQFSGALSASVCSGQVGGSVWLDADCSGRLGPGDMGIPGVTVQLEDEAGELAATTVTGADGRFVLVGVCSGVYALRVELGPLAMGLAATVSGAGDPVGDSDLSPARVELASDEASIEALDFGFKAVGSIGDRVWLDLDCDGVEDAGEPGLSGVRVELREIRGEVLASVDTGDDGRYTFDGLDSGVCTPPGGYVVAVDLASQVLAGLFPGADFDSGADAQVRVELGAGARRADIDFAFESSAASSIGGRVYVDSDCDGVDDTGEPGLGGVQVELRGPDGEELLATGETATDGAFSFAEIAAGRCQTPGEFVVAVILSSPALGGLVPGADLDGGGDARARVLLAAGEARTDVAFAFEIRAAGSISGRVYADGNCDGVEGTGEPGIGGVIVALRDESGEELLAAAETAADGTFTFAEIAAGRCQSSSTFLVAVDLASAPLAGLVPGADVDGGADARALVTLEAGMHLAGVSFAFQGSAMGSIGDRIWLDRNCDGVTNSGEPGIGGVRVELRAQSGELLAVAETSTDGTYVFPELESGGCNSAVAYSVIVDRESPALVGLLPGVDLDGGADSRARVELPAGAERTDTDFAFRPVVCEEILPECDSFGYLRSVLRVAGLRVSGRNIPLGEMDECAVGFLRATTRIGAFRITGFGDARRSERSGRQERAGRR